MVARHSHNVHPVTITYSEQIASGIFLFGFKKDFDFRAGLASQKILIHGSRTLENFHFFDDFNTLLGRNYIRCSTGEQDRNVYSGRVTEYLEEQSILNTGVKYYLCGSAEMVVETRDILISKGIPFDQIVSEIYF